MRIWIPALAALILVGCSKPASVPPGAIPASAVAADAAAPPGAADKKLEPPDKAVPPVGAPMLAYSYDDGIEAPASGIRALIARHQHACAAAGVAVCQVTGSNIEARGRDSVHATLALRATPAWLARFGDTLTDDATHAGGRLVHATVTSEDLTRQIVDTEAAIRAKTALRDRLQALLETHPGKLSDLLDVETALSDAQDKLDATQSELAVMRERVATSVMTLDYQSTGGMSSVVGWLLGLAIAVGGVIWLAREVLPKGPPPSGRKPVS